MHKYKSSVTSIPPYPNGQHICVSKHRVSTRAAMNTQRSAQLKPRLSLGTRRGSSSSNPSPRAGHGAAKPSPQHRQQRAKPLVLKSAGLESVAGRKSQQQGSLSARRGGGLQQVGLRLAEQGQRQFAACTAAVE